MASALSDFEKLLRRIGYEARKNSPLSIMALSMVCLWVMVGLGFRSFQMLAAPLLTFTGGAFAAVLGYLQSIRDDTPANGSDAGTSSGATAVANAGSSARTLELIDFVTQIRSTADGTIALLRKQIARLGFRANLNLAVGVSICLLGFVILGYFVFSDTGTTIIEMIKRLSLVLFIEVFAYFFLNLYRAGLFDIKYFQNELTNAGFRLIAIDVAFAKGDSSTIKKLCDELSKTERNFLLKKNETTHDLRQAEQIIQGEKSLSETLMKVVQMIIPHNAHRSGDDSGAPK